MEKKTKVLFAGSGEFSWPVLEGLLDGSQYEVVGVLTQPHKPQGREQKLAPAFLEQALIQNRPEVLESLPIFRPDKLRTQAEEILAQVKPELVVVAAYGQIIPNIMLEFSEYGCVNFHGSILPQLRGAVPVPMAILKGLTETGVTLQKMVAQLDAGDIIAIQKTSVKDDDTAKSLMAKLAQIAKQMVSKELVEYIDGTITPATQNHEEATFCYAADIAKEKAEITVDTPIIDAERMIRAFSPWPVAWVQIEVNGESKRMKIFAARTVNDLALTEVTTGRISRSGKNLYMSLKNGILQLDELQLEGKKQGSASDYLFLHDAKLLN